MRRIPYDLDSARERSIHRLATANGRRLGLLQAAKIAAAERDTVPSKSYLHNYAHNEAEKIVQRGYELACNDIEAAARLASQERGK